MNTLRPLLHLLGAAILTVAIALPAAAAGGHEQITGPFVNVQGVTLQCLGCHAKQGQDILQSSHWTWQRRRTIDGTEQSFSKKEGLTTFAIAAWNNPEQCMYCHISINLRTPRFDPTSPIHVDCLVCHDTTGTYRRVDGQPVDGLDLVRIARTVGTPSATNCSSCHANGCGLPGSPEHGGVEPDVHFTPDGGSLRCQDCHPSGNRHAFDRRLVSGIGPQQTSNCATCHGRSPHRQQELNRHGEIIDCRTCHIPTYGRETPAVVSWNWLAQTRAEVFRLDGKQAVPVINANGLTLAADALPTYLWDDGGETVYQRGVKIDPDAPTVLMGPTKRSARSKITPFAVSYATQLYDAKYRYLISPKLSARTGSYFEPDNWAPAAENGMLALRLPFSGTYGFTSTTTYRRVSHGVRPVNESLDCMDCHGKSSRMPWKQLGYETDPWAWSAPPPPPVQPGPEEQVQPTLPLIEESVLPGSGTGG